MNLDLLRSDSLSSSWCLDRSLAGEVGEIDFLLGLAGVLSVFELLMLKSWLICSWLIWARALGGGDRGGDDLLESSKAKQFFNLGIVDKDHDHLVLLFRFTDEVDQNCGLNLTEVGHGLRHGVTDWPVLVLPDCLTVGDWLTEDSWIWSCDRFWLISNLNPRLFRPSKDDPLLFRPLNPSNISSFWIRRIFLPLWCVLIDLKSSTISST